MAIPFTYIVRNLVARRLTTVLTAGGMALVVYVFATVLMLSAGLKATLVATGQDDNIIVIRRGAQTEVQSGIDRRQAGIVESLPDIAIGLSGERLISKEPVVLINLPKRASGKAVQRRDSRHRTDGAGVAAQGENRRGPDVPARHVGSDHRAGHRRRLSGRGRGRDAALRLARLDGRRRVRRRTYRIRFRDLGRCRAIPAGVPTRRLFRAAVQARRPRALRRGEGSDRVRPSADTRSQARDALLRRPVRVAGDDSSSISARRSRSSFPSARSSVR